MVGDTNQAPEKTNGGNHAEPEPLKTAEQIRKDKEATSQPPKDFKVAEIWIKDGTVALDACPDFWMDKLRALGIMEYCKEIIMTYNPVTPQKKSLIQKVNMQGFRNFIRGKRKT